MPVIVPVKAWADHRSGATVYYIDGQPIAGIGAVPLANLSNWSRGALIIGGVATWGATAHPGGAGYALTTDANDTLWDQTPAWSGRHTFSAGIELPDSQSIGITGNELLTVNAAGTFAFSGIVGVTVEDADWIGNGAAAARLGFDSSGVQDYAYFSSCFLGIGIATPDGTAHVHTATAGVVAADANANDLVVENSGTGGITILTPDANSSLLYFGSPTDSSGAQVRWNYSDLHFRVGTLTAGGFLGLYVGNGSEAIRIDTNGDVGIAIAAPSAQLHIDQASATGAQPVLYLDQGDVSEQHIVLSMSGADQDFPNIIQLNVTGSPALWWDESESAFGWKNISGLLLEDADWIGNSGSSARLTFDSSGVDYAYFSDCRIGIDVVAPQAMLQIDQSSTVATIPVLYLDQGDVSEPCILVSVSGADADIKVLRANVTGNPTVEWDESESAFAFVNVSGVTVENADWIGNSGTSARLVFDSSGTNYANFAHGLVYINETANTGMTLGLTINQAANDDEIFAGKSSDVAHPFTDYAEADTYFAVGKHSGVAGGALVEGFRDSDGDAGWAMVLRGYLGESAQDGKVATSGAIVMIDGFITDGGTGIGDTNANGNIAAFRTFRNSALETVVIIDEDGDIYYDGSLQNYDDFDDALAVQDARAILTGRWNDALTYNAEALSKMGVISLNKDGTPAMVSHKRMAALMAGAIGQLRNKIQELEARLETA